MELLKGELVEIYEKWDGPLVTDEFAFYGHCEEDEIDWRHVQESVNWVEVGDDEIPLPRDYYTKIRHAYGWWELYQKGEEDSMIFEHSYKEEPESFPISIVYFKCDIRERRLWRGLSKSIVRRVRKVYPEAYLIDPNPYQFSATFRLPYMVGNVNVDFKKISRQIRHNDSEIWNVLYNRGKL